MKKILKSAFVIVAVGAFATGATMSFFSDSESSENNTFSAGAIDLQVDSTAHYNGLVCQDGEWVEDSGCEETGESLLANGSFELPEVEDGANWDIFENGSPGLEWTVEWESDQTSFGGHDRPENALLELHRGVNGWSVQDGEQYAELDSDWVGPGTPPHGEPALVRIYQEVGTTPGESYRLRYSYSPRPGTNAENNELNVMVGGSQVASHSEAGGSDTDWTEHEHVFEAENSSTTIGFVAGGDADSLGVFLDNVSLFELDCNETAMSELVGEECGGTWELTDLGPSHKFFDYQDVKPGDFGENTVSLHVLNNDAYACMLINNVENDENDLIEPEEEAGDESTDEGELAENLEFFAWHDDGDNVWEDGEAPLFSSMTEPGEEFLGGKTFPIFTPGTGALGQGTTEYIGIAWCAGSMEIDEEENEIGCDGSTVGNEAQTDSFMADLTFFVEQTRHNGEFSCPELEN